MIVGYGVRSALGVGLCSGGGLFSVQQSMAVEVVTPRRAHDMPDLSSLPPGQARAVESLIGAFRYRTYAKAAEAAGAKAHERWVSTRVKCDIVEPYSFRSQESIQQKIIIMSREYYRDSERSSLILYSVELVPAY